MRNSWQGISISDLSDQLVIEELSSLMFSVV